LYDADNIKNFLRYDYFLRGGAFPNHYPNSIDGVDSVSLGLPVPNISTTNVDITESDYKWLTYSIGDFYMAGDEHRTDYMVTFFTEDEGTTDNSFWKNDASHSAYHDLGTSLIGIDGVVRPNVTLYEWTYNKSTRHITNPKTELTAGVDYEVIVEKPYKVGFNRVYIYGKGNYRGVGLAVVNLDNLLTHPNVPAIQGTYGQTLSQIELPSGWCWDSPNNYVGNAGQQIHMASFAGNEENYAIANCEIGITVNRATPIYSIPTDLTAIFGQILADISLPDGWAWETPAAAVGSKYKNAIFTPADTDNYLTIKENLTVVVTGGDGEQDTDSYPQNPTQTWVAFGDSITAGEGVGRTNSYADQFAAANNFEINNMAVSGYTSSDLLALLNGLSAAQWDSIHRSDGVILCIGANDILSRVGTAIGTPTTPQEIMAAIGALQSPAFETSMQTALDNFKTNFIEILDKIKNDNIIILTIYNPYSGVEVGDFNLGLLAETYITELNTIIKAYAPRYFDMFAQIRAYEDEHGFPPVFADFTNLLNINYDPHLTLTGQTYVAEQLNTYYLTQVSDIEQDPDIPLETDGDDESDNNSIEPDPNPNADPENGEQENENSENENDDGEDDGKFIPNRESVPFEGTVVFSLICLGSVLIGFFSFRQR
jgi:lysophospholipase L1-like esterase